MYALGTNLGIFGLIKEFTNCVAILRVELA